MKIKEIVSALERFAPLPLQDGFDNAGLQIGLTDAEATWHQSAAKPEHQRILRQHRQCNVL